MRAGPRRAGALVAWFVLLAAAVGALELAGRVLPAPPLSSPSRWPAWLSGRDPVVVAFSVVRLLALGFAWYALVVTVAGACARLSAAAPVTAGLDRLTLPALRRVLVATMSVGLGSASLTPATAGAAPAAVAAPAPTTTTTAPSESLTMRELPPLGEAPGALSPAAPVEASPPQPWTVRPGECFWSIAEDVLASALGRRPTAAEIVPYWRRLVDANRPVLADRDNPDLVFPGQVFTVPDPRST